MPGHAGLRSWSLRAADEWYIPWGSGFGVEVFFDSHTALVVLSFVQLMGGCYHDGGPGDIERQLN